MKTNLAFDFSVNKENNTIIVKRVFSAELSFVWDAYTRSEILDQWWAPKPWIAKTKFMDFRNGGYWLYAMVGPNGEEHWSRADFKNIQFQKRYSGLDAFTDSDGNINNDLPRSEWEVTFTSMMQNTLVEIRITYDDLSQLEETIKMGFKDGLSMAMEGLDELISKIGN